MDAAAFRSFRRHGGRTAAAARQFPEVALPWIDLSTGISPWAYPIGESDLASWTRLPEPEALAALEAAAAAAFDVADPEEVVAVPGSDLAIRLLGSILKDHRVSLLEPIFSGHRAAWPDARAVRTYDEPDSGLLVLANPNNPDGRIIPPEKLRALPCPFLVDEAFADAMPAASILPHRPGTAIVLRSFGKFFGLAGIRLGFVIASLPIAARLRTSLGDWPVSGPAIAVATRAYHDLDWQAAQRERLLDAASRLDALLIGAGLVIAGGTPLFRLAHCDDAESLFTSLAQAGILVRPFEGDRHALRFGLPGNGENWQRLRLALQQWRMDRDR